MRHFLMRERRRIEACIERLRPDPLLRQCAQGHARLADLGHRLDVALPRIVARKREQQEALAGRLESHALSHEKVLERGYAVVRDARRMPLVAARDVAAGSTLLVEFHDGEVAAVAGNTGRRTRSRAAAAETPQQPKLL
jgi:exodeoxyribonuclease VII large subunit